MAAILEEAECTFPARPQASLIALSTVTQLQLAQEFASTNPPHYSTLTNCTFVRNTASSHGGGIYCAGSSPRITNSILWEDSPDEVYNETAASNPTITYSNILGGYSGAGNINANPLFVGIATGDFHLTSSSPSINAGSNAAPELPATDRDGNPRIVNGTVDMGAYEFQTAEVFPSLDITMSKSTYVVGDALTATEFRLRNQGTTAQACELKVWLIVPGIPPIGFFNLGSDGSFVIPAGFNQNFGPLTLLSKITDSVPKGNYEFDSRMVNPVTAQFLSQDLNSFVIQ